MKLTYLMIFCTIAASATAASIELYETKQKEIELKSVSIEDSSEDVLEENPSNVHRRSIGFLLGNFIDFNPFKSLVFWKHSGRNYNYHDRCSNSHHNHGHHDNHWHGHQHYHTELPIDTTTMLIPRFTTEKIKTTTTESNKILTIPSIDNNQLAPTTLPTTTIMTSKPSTTLIPTTTRATTTTTITTTPIPVTSTSTPRYQDPDNELIYDIDLRFRV